MLKNEILLNNNQLDAYDEEKLKKIIVSLESEDLLFQLGKRHFEKKDYQIAELFLIKAIALGNAEAEDFLKTSKDTYASVILDAAIKINRNNSTKRFCQH